MALVTLKEILDHANEHNYGVPAIDALEHATVEAVIQAAEKVNTPLILMFPENTMALYSNIGDFFDFIVDRAKNAKVPVAVELDHGETFENIVFAIRHGFSSVMIDGSSLPLEENIALTKKVVEVAHAVGVSVEAEIGHVSGGEGNIDGGSEVDTDMFTKPEEAKYFYEETGVDALAVAFGTVHGLYSGTPKLDLERLQEIKKVIPGPLVMHGGSGLTDEDFQAAIRNGISKVNIFTEISLETVKNSVAYANSKESKLHFLELIKVAQSIASERAEKFLTLFKNA